MVQLLPNSVNISACGLMVNYSRFLFLELLYINSNVHKFHNGKKICSPYCAIIFQFVFIGNKIKITMTSCITQTSHY